MARKMEKLLPSERLVQNRYFEGLRVPERKTRHSVIVAAIGLVGSGKSTVAKYLADLIGAVVISGDEIRILLRNEGVGYDKARLIGENVLRAVITAGGSIVLDSDFVDKNKRESLRQIAKKAGAKLYFVRTICDFDVLSQRIRENDPGEFFNEAETKSASVNHGRDVKFREMLRRLPQHYKWQNISGGKLALRKFPFVTFETVDTTTDAWKDSINSIAVSILHELQKKSG
ncbi:hypothetical protein A2W54_03485 [Candidatus Giovannonibacteria bacterium RIFCSPHIGHO2_02_43_13]|uniref:UDP-N-acetylglucosamine kinase n=1 Tax=Candidatus Giovannonibacteria bacterium RIFCSPHIGHO2_02_43_13 TaxID=1798330 RepID=A0A1F5WQ94_9BACT|nr:MAG: hypothetical protein A2W54_03485 [Candidatus Giovannonibacteria bacterium RIFCSPHIGHO2_02_43_13]